MSEVSERVLELRKTWTIPVLIKRWTMKNGNIDYIELLNDLHTIYPNSTDEELMLLVNLNI